MPPLIAALWLAEVPALLDPLAARAEVAARAPCVAPEAALYAGRPEDALRAVGEACRENPVFLRVEGLAHARLAAVARAERVADALALWPGWAEEADRLRSFTAAARRRALAVQAGAGLFALCLTFLVLGAMRELLRLDRSEAAPLGLLVAGAAVGVLAGAPGLAVFAGAGVALAHAALAAARRIEPLARGRALLVAVLGAGLAGVGFALGLG